MWIIRSVVVNVMVPMETVVMVTFSMMSMAVTMRCWNTAEAHHKTYKQLLIKEKGE